MGSSRTRDQTRVSFIGWWTLIHPTRCEVLYPTFWKCLFLEQHFKKLLLQGHSTCHLRNLYVMLVFFFLFFFLRLPPSVLHAISWNYEKHTDFQKMLNIKDIFFHCFEIETLSDCSHFWCCLFSDTYTPSKYLPLDWYSCEKRQITMEYVSVKFRGDKTNIAV